MTDTNPEPDVDIAAVIKERLATIDDQLDHLVAERSRISNEIKHLREERVPLQRLARAAEPRTRSRRPPVEPTPIQGVVAERTP